MEKKPLLSIAIPTYNRVAFLQTLLENIVPQALALSGMLQICISNNHSTDATAALVADFEQKYPGLIKYRENEKNIGAHANFLKVMEMADGGFVWLLGDDDVVIAGGIKKVIDVISRECNENTGLLVLACQSYFIDADTKQEVTYSTTFQKDKPQVYGINRKDIIGQRFGAAAFISILLFNNQFFKKILQEEKALVQKAIEAKEYIHAFLYRLMFLKYPRLQALWLNEAIVRDEAHLYKFYVEDIFQLHYITWIKLCDLLLSSGYVASGDRAAIIADKKRVVKIVIMEMAMIKCFNAFNFSSYIGCIRMFFKEAPFWLAVVFSAFFTGFCIIPSTVLRNAYKLFVIIKHQKNWKKIWLYVVVKNAKMSQGSRRLYDYGT